MAGDELSHGIAEKRVLCDWLTDKPGFPPTFKVERATRVAPDDVVGGSGLPGGAAAVVQAAYNHKRIPSWTDRVLWHRLSSVVCCLSRTHCCGCRVLWHRCVGNRLSPVANPLLRLLLACAVRSGSPWLALGWRSSRRCSRLSDSVVDRRRAAVTVVSAASRASPSVPRVDTSDAHVGAPPRVRMWRRLPSPAPPPHAARRCRTQNERADVVDDDCSLPPHKRN